MFITLLMVVLELFAARQVVAFLANNEIIGLSTFAVNLLVLMVIAASTDYATFVLGRYQEARSLGEDREQAFFTKFHGTAHVVLGSGLTIAGAMYCLSFTRLPYFQSPGVPCAVGTLVAVLAALTLGPAVLTVGSRFGLFDPSGRCGRGAGGGWGPPSSGGPARSWPCRSASRSSACSRCPVTGRITTTASICLRARRPSSVAALMGRWFWWPTPVRTRPASQMLRPYGSRSAVRAYMLPTEQPRPRGTNGDSPDSANTDRFRVGTPHYCFSPVVTARSTRARDSRALRLRRTGSGFPDSA